MRWSKLLHPTPHAYEAPADANNLPVLNSMINDLIENNPPFPIPHLTRVLASE